MIYDRSVVSQPEIKFVSKGWGFEKWVVNTDKYCGKLLFFAKGKKCSLHYHKIKDETFYVHRGKLRLFFCDDIDKLNKVVKENDNDKYNFLEQLVLNQGDNFYVPAGRVHQMFAMEDTEMFEFSTEHKEEDSIRVIKGD